MFRFREHRRRFTREVFMKRSVLFIVFILLLNAVYGQQDSNPPDEGKIKAVYMRGVMALANNDLNGAEKNFNEIIGASETDEFNLDQYKAKAYYFLGDVYFIRKNFERSIKNYRVVTEKFYNQDVYSKGLYKLGRTLVINDRFKEGLEILKDYLEKYQNQDAFADNAYYWMAKAFIGLKDYQPALNSYHLILEKFPYSTLAYDIRNSIDSLEKIIDEQNKMNMKNTSKIDESQTISQKREKLVQEKELLDKMSKLLKIKQRMLEIKAEKVELLKAIKQQNEQESK